MRTVLSAAEGGRRRTGARVSLLAVAGAGYVISAWMANRAICPGCAMEEVRLPVRERPVRGRLYSPSNDGRFRPGVVVCHGYLANLAYLEVPWAADLTALGAVALFIDRRGHGRTPGRLWPRTDGGAEAPGGLEPGVLAGIDYLRSLEPRVDPERIALIGHSDGGTAALIAGSEDWKVRATAALSASVAPWDRVNHVAPRNLLLVYGAQDRYVLHDTDRMLIRQSTRGYLDGPGSYGRLEDGSARRLVVVPDRGHVDLMYSDRARRETLRWLKRSLNAPGEIAPAALRIPWLAAGAAAILLGLSVRRRDASGRARPRRFGYASAAILALCSSWLAGLLLASRLAPLLRRFPAQEGAVFGALAIGVTATLGPAALAAAWIARRTGTGVALRLAGRQGGSALRQGAVGALTAIVVIGALRLLLLHFHDVPLSRERFLLLLLFTALALPAFGLLQAWLNAVARFAGPAAEASALAALAAITAALGGHLFERMAALPSYLLAATLIVAAAHRVGQAGRQPVATVILAAILFARAAAAVCALY